MFNRRDVLRASAAVVASVAAPAAADEGAAADLRRLVDRLADRSRVTRPFLLQRFNASRLTPRERVLFDALLPGAEADAALARRTWGASGQPYPVTHRTGAYRRAAELRPGDRIRHAVRAVNQDTNELEARAQRGVAPPDFLIDATLPALRNAARQVETAGVADGDTLIAALARQSEALEAQRRAAGSEPGVWRFPGGDEFYAQTLQFQLGAPVDAHYAHELAVARCREFQSEAGRLLRAQGLVHGSVAERLRAFARDDRFVIRDRGALIAKMNAQLARTRELLAPALNAAASGGVLELDLGSSSGGTRGQRNGVNYLADLATTRPTWSFASVAHHEHTPGHLLQSQFNRGVPTLQLRYGGGYGEGWPIYAEMLADELGAFEGDAPARIGYLQWMMFRMARVAGDTGIHAMRWSRERAIAEMHELQGESISFVSIEEDVTRFTAQPGASAVQGLAALELMELRERTRRAAGAEFTLARFHDAALRAGPLSPPGLEQAMRAAFDL